MSNSFFYEGPISSSKSLFNRALIIQSFYPSLVIQGFSDCDDVRYMQSALKSFKNSSSMNCGEGGTTFRFLALRASREKGSWLLGADPKLLRRPQKGLVDLLLQLGCEAEMSPEGLKVSSQGWKKPLGPLQIDPSVSSQFASALLLSAWELEFDLEFSMMGAVVSEAYLEMTCQLVERLGMKVERYGTQWKIPKGQTLCQGSYSVEADVSSVFAVAALAALGGECRVHNFPKHSLQPDKVFVDFLQEMGTEIQIVDSLLVVRKAPELRNIDVNLKNCPDLFPVLSSLCAFATGTSHLRGAPHLVAKESNRIAEISKLFQQIGVAHQCHADGMSVNGVQNRKLNLMGSKNFDPAGDHRMVMAAALFNLAGAELKVQNASCVDKSFPEFLEIAKGYL